MSKSSPLQSFIPRDHRPPVKGGRLSPYIERPPLTLPDNLALGDAASALNHAVVLGPQSDFVVKLIERRLKPDTPVSILYYEDLGFDWSYLLENGRLGFVYFGKLINPTRVYVRGAVVDAADPRYESMGTLLSCINSWPGPVLCRPANQLPNESKLFQGQASIRKAWQQMGRPSEIGMIPSLACLGDHVPDSEALRRRLGEKHIVKSLSGIRSLVASSETFGNWDWRWLRAGPALFQERIEGFDLRVHYLKGKTWSLKVQSKSEVDYRYAVSRSEMEPHTIPEVVKQFCAQVAKIEKNELMGLDFIVTENRYYCLEANPGPGWAWYHEQEKCGDSFFDSFMTALTESGPTTGRFSC